MRTCWSFCLLLAAGTSIACREQVSVPEAQPTPPAHVSEAPIRQAQPVVVDVAPAFADVARQYGIDFTFFNDEVEGRFFLPEVMGGGAAWIDFDRDGWLDLYLVNGAPLISAAAADRHFAHALYRNDQGERFVMVSQQAGTVVDRFGQGCCVGDFDSDGFPDLFLANYGQDVLLANNGDGSFRDVTARANVGCSWWGTSPVWVELNGDDKLDLFVTTYLDATPENLQVCTYNGKPGYCGPGEYEAAPDRAYLNNGDGTFSEAADELGLLVPNGKGLAVAVADFDGDAQPEIYVANDMEENFLFQRDSAGGRRYRNVAQESGCAVSGDGNAEASMGAACADFDRDGLVDLFLSHYYGHKNTLYRNLGGLLFEDDSRRSRVAATSFETLGFGTIALDYDMDGANDLFIANGHVLGPLHEPNAMRPQLLHNDGRGRFDEVSQLAGSYFQQLWLGRGAAGADFDNDGDCDLAVTHLHRPLALLRNDTSHGRHYLGVELRTSQRLPPWGARVVVRAGDHECRATLVGGGSYLCSSDERLLIGLGEAVATVDVEIHWPSQHVDRHAGLAVDQYWQLTENKRPLVPIAATRAAR